MQPCIHCRKFPGTATEKLLNTSGKKNPCFLIQISGFISCQDFKFCVWLVVVLRYWKSFRLLMFEEWGFKTKGRVPGWWPWGSPRSPNSGWWAQWNTTEFGNRSLVRCWCSCDHLKFGVEQGLLIGISWWNKSIIFLCKGFSSCQTCFKLTEETTAQ